MKGGRGTRLGEDFGPAALVILVFLPSVLGRAAPWLLGEFRALMLGFGVSFAMGALALNLLMGYAGQISLGHAAFVGVGAYSAGIASTKLGLPFPAGQVAGAVVGGLVALLVGVPALRVRGLYLAVATVAFAAAMQVMVFRIPAISGGQAGLPIPPPSLLGFSLAKPYDYLSLLLGALVGLWLLDRNLTRSKVGRALFAIREAEDLAASFGIDVTRYKLLAFLLAGIFAGLAGSLYGPLLGLAQADAFGFEVSLFYLILVVVGGMGHRGGVLAASVLFAVLPRVLQVLKGWDLLAGSVLLIYTIARNPGGLAGAFIEARRRRKKGRPPKDGHGPLPRLVLPRVRPGEWREPGGEAALLEVSDLHYSYGGVKAVAGMDLEVWQGQIVGVIGPNGAGKTTLLNCVSGLLVPERGKISFRGVEITRVPAHLRAELGIRRTFQVPGVLGNLSVLENFLVAQHLAAGYSTLEALARTSRVRSVEAELKERAMFALAALGLADRAEDPVRSLSGGQQRLVELGCVLVSAPTLILLDEPSAGMSPAASEELAERLVELKRELGRTLLVVEHHIPLVVAVCDKVFVMAEGRLLAGGAPREVLKNPAVVDAYLGGTLARAGG